jgi:two-component system alkaline phosphatase synthesis response regulator PhoP
MSKPKILVVDDEKDLLDLIEYNLIKEGYLVYKAENGLEGLKAARSVVPDLIILDVMMPRMDGMELIELLKKDDGLKHIPVIFLTAKADEQSEVRGLEKGADDYIVKPVTSGKLVSRVKATLRRTGLVENASNVIEIHGYTIDRDRYVVRKGDIEFQLPKKEFELLYFLSSRRGKVLDRQTLLNEVWGSNVYVIDRTIDVHIRKIREKLGEDLIETVKGVGYRFKE